ncbi:hypothetical protein R1flu_007578 [Riccia fluitans]|uniref:Uncharacterized protein n=1 Tax=Riccia fluitans TaxID=41844 RepID=A0ABD1Z1Z4_9MARC
MRTHGIQLQQMQSEAIKTFQMWLCTIQMGPQKLKHSPSWRWKTAETEWKGWLRPSKFWHSLYEMEELLDDLSTKWQGGAYDLTWNIRWRKLWEKGRPPRVKLWTWKLLY